MEDNSIVNPASEDKITNLLSLMTLEEKVGQLNQISIFNFDDEKFFGLISQGHVGSIILAATPLAGHEGDYTFDAQKLNELQKLAVEKSRLGIPLIFGRDVIHGYRTVFPIPLAQAASWDLDLVETAASIAAKEARSEGIHWTFAPMVDIARDPRWGRIIEGCGEDPFLASELAKAQVRGFQRRAADGTRPLAACVKHFVGYGAAEGGRDYNSTDIPDYTLRNIYLPPFQAAVEAGVCTVMSSFNDISGEPVTSSYRLLTDVLKREFGFNGFVVSDWYSIIQLVNQGVAVDGKGAARSAFQAGLDMDMVDQCYYIHLKNLVREGKISIDRLDDAVRRILRVKIWLGLFEHPYTDPESKYQLLLQPGHIAHARKLASNSMVLLKNEEALLPLPKKGIKIAVLGPMAKAKDNHLGSWALDGREQDVVGIIEGIREVAPEVEIYSTTSDLMEDQVDVARPADFVVIALGESRCRTGEGHSVAQIQLSRDQEELLREISSIKKKIISIVCAGRPISLANLEPYSQVVLYAWHSGIQAGVAIADILFGDVNPSARLPVTFPRSSGQIPLYYNHRHTGRKIDEYYGNAEFRNYDDISGKPQYPFGYGLSYTRFEYKNIAIDKQKITTGENINVSIQVKNIGDRVGEEIVQCYLSDKVASIIRPVKELKGFKKVKLQPGETKTITFTLGKVEMSFYTHVGEFILEKGHFAVGIGGDCLRTLEIHFEVS